MAETNKTKTEKTIEKEKTVRLMIPLTKVEKDDVYVSVNDRSWLIKRGEEVEVPVCVAEVLRNKAEMEKVAISYSESFQS